MGRFGKAYRPCSSLCVSLVRLVAVLRAVTLTAGTTAPVASLVVPDKSAASCASAGGLSITNKNASSEAAKIRRDIFRIRTSNGQRNYKGCAAAQLKPHAYEERPRTA